MLHPGLASGLLVSPSAISSMLAAWRLQTAFVDMPPSINDVMSLGDLASWMKAYDWCSFQFDDKAFPDPASYLRTVKDKYNVKVCVWINPYICESGPVVRGLFDVEYQR